MQMMNSYHENSKRNNLQMWVTVDNSYTGIELPTYKRKTPAHHHCSAASIPLHTSLKRIIKISAEKATEDHSKRSHDLWIQGSAGQDPGVLWGRSRNYMEISILLINCFKAIALIALRQSRLRCNETLKATQKWDDMANYLRHHID